MLSFLQLLAVAVAAFHSSRPDATNNFECYQINVCIVRMIMELQTTSIHSEQMLLPLCWIHNIFYLLDNKNDFRFCYFTVDRTQSTCMTINVQAPIRFFFCLVFIYSCGALQKDVQLHTALLQHMHSGGMGWGLASQQQESLFAYRTTE